MHRNQAVEPQQIADFHSGYQQFFRDSRDLLTIPGNIADLQRELCSTALKQEEYELKRARQLEDLSLRSESLCQQTDSIFKATSQMQKKMSWSMLTIMSISEDIRSISRLLGTFSHDFLAKIAAHGYVKGLFRIIVPPP